MSLTTCCFDKVYIPTIMVLSNELLVETHVGKQTMHLGNVMMDFLTKSVAVITCMTGLI